MKNPFAADLTTVESIERAQDATAPPKHWTIDDASAQWAITTVRKYGLARRISQWKSDDVEMLGRHAGGASTRFSDEALLVVMLLAARHQKPMLATIFAEGLFHGLSATVREELDLPESATDELGRLAEERNVRTRLHRIIDVMDPTPAPTYKRLTPDELEQKRPHLPMTARRHAGNDYSRSQICCSKSHIVRCHVRSDGSGRGPLPSTRLRSSRLLKVPNDRRTRHR